MGGGGGASLGTAAAFALPPQSNAELAVRDMLRDFARRQRQQTGSLEVESEDFMDDGTPIRLRVQINEGEVRKGKNTEANVSEESIVFLKNVPRFRAVQCLTSAGREPKFGATATLHAPSPCPPSSTACAAWWDRTFPSTR